MLDRLAPLSLRPVNQALVYSSRCCKLGMVLVHGATVRERLEEEVAARGRTTPPVKADVWWHTRERLRKAAQARVAAAAILDRFTTAKHSE